METPNYDAHIMNAPFSKIADDEVICVQCDQRIREQDISEVQLELSVCSDQCAYKELRELRQKLDVLNRQENTRQLAGRAS